MKGMTSATKGLPKGENLDRLVALALTVFGQLELWFGNPTPGLAKAVAAPLTIAVTGSVAFRRRWPLAAGSVAVLGTGSVFIVARNYSIAVGVAWMCALYGIAVWTDTRDFIAGLALLVILDLASLVNPHQTPSNVFLFIVIPGIGMLLARRAVRDRELRADTLAARADLLAREQENRSGPGVRPARSR